MPVWTDLTLSKSEMVRSLHGWWMSHRGPSGMPDRKAFDPLDHIGLLPNLMVAEVEPEPFRIRFRLVGTKVVATAGQDFTGRYLDDLLEGADVAPWLEYYAACYASREPLLGSVSEPTTSGGTFTYEFGFFPVTLGGGAVNQVIAIEDYFGFGLTSAGLRPWPLKP